MHLLEWMYLIICLGWRWCNNFTKFCERWFFGSISRFVSRFGSSISRFFVSLKFFLLHLSPDRSLSDIKSVFEKQYDFIVGEHRIEFVLAYDRFWKRHKPKPEHPIPQKLSKNRKRRPKFTEFCVVYKETIAAFCRLRNHITCSVRPQSLLFSYFRTLLKRTSRIKKSSD